MEEHRFFTRKQIRKALKVIAEVDDAMFSVELFEIGEYSHIPKTLKFTKNPSSGIIYIDGENQWEPLNEHLGMSYAVSVARSQDDYIIDLVYNNEFNIDSRRL